MILRPLIADWQCLSGSESVGTVVVDPSDDAILADHVYKGTPLLPAAAILEIFAEAVERQQSSAGPTVLEQVQFVNGIRCFTSSPQTLHVRLNLDSQRAACELTQEFRNRDGKLLDAARHCASTRLPLKPTYFDDWGWLSPQNAAWRDVLYSQGSANRLGPSLRGLQTLLLQVDQGWGEILAGDERPWKPSAPGGWRFSPGVLDAALVACNLWVCQHRPGAMQLPSTMRRVWLGDNPPAGSRLIVHFHVQEVTDDTAAYDVRVRDAQGRTVLKIDDYVCGLIREPGETPIRLGPPRE